jgi:hypothetical protein
MAVTRARVRFVVWAVAGILVSGYCGFVLSRPLLERRLRARLERAAARRGLQLTIGTLRLTPGLTLELRDLTLAAGDRLQITTDALDARPGLLSWPPSPLAARVRLAGAVARLPRAVRIDVTPSSWLVGGLFGRRLEWSARGETLSLLYSTPRGGQRLALRARGARLSELVRVSMAGCELLAPGSLDGEGRLERDAAGAVRLSLQANAHGLTLGSLGGPVEQSCSTGSATDVELKADAVLDRAAGLLRVDLHRLRAAGAEAAGRLVVSGGPRIELALTAKQLDLARVLAAAGVRLADGAEADDLGRAALALDVAGPLRDPRSLRVTQRVDFQPPARVPRALTRLRDPFLHHALSSDGRDHPILVSPESADFVPLAEVPPFFVRTLLLGEDAGFFGHHGIDLGELPAALATNLARGGYARGASTIPQQLAKNLFLSRRKTLARKLAEAALALLLDSTLGKERELEIYLNVIEWGPGIYGLRPAARHYFGKEPASLTPKQTAFLVSLIPGPLRYQRSFADGEPSPFLAGQIENLLDKLEASGAMSPEEHAAALAEPLGLLDTAWGGEATTEPQEPPAVDAPESSL